MDIRTTYPYMYKSPWLDDSPVVYVNTYIQTCKLKEQTRVRKYSSSKTRVLEAVLPGTEGWYWRKVQQSMESRNKVVSVLLEYFPLISITCN